MLSPTSEMVEYLRDLSCDGCGKVLARSGTYSQVFDLDDHPIDLQSEVDAPEDATADYEMLCDCGVNREFHSPEDARRTSRPASAYAASRRAYRLF